MNSYYLALNMNVGEEHYVYKQYFGQMVWPLNGLAIIASSADLMYCVLQHWFLPISYTLWT